MHITHLYDKFRKLDLLHLKVFLLLKQAIIEKAWLAASNYFFKTVNCLIYNLNEQVYQFLDRFSY